MMTGMKAGFPAGNRQAILASALVVVTALTSAFTATPARAQQAGNSTPMMTQLQSEKRFDIPAQPLTDALVAFGRQSGIQVTVDGTLARHRSSPAVHGTMSGAEALTRLLAGSGLTYIVADETTVAIEKPGQQSDAGPIVLGPITVEGKTGSAYGPVDGYVATRSATATKTDTPIIETPQSISVISREEMDDRDVRDVGEVVSYTSGVFAGGTGETKLFGGSSVRIRGFGGGGTAGASFNEYLDGLKLQGSNYVVSNFDPWLFERVEVLKGPTSVLFGQTQPGGIVNMISKRPHADMVNAIRLGTGNFDHGNAALDVGGELNDEWRFRLVGLGLTGDTQQDHSDRKRSLVAPALHWTDGRTDLTLLSHYQHDDINASILSIIPRDGVFSNPNGRVPLSFRVGDPGFEFWDRTTWSIGYLFSHSINDSLTFRQNLRYTKNKQNSRWIYRSSLDSDQRTLNRRSFASEEDSRILSLDNQLEWKTTTGIAEHTLLAGFDYQNFSDEGRAAGGAAPTIDLFAPVYYQTIPASTSVFWDDEDDIRQLGFYLQDQIKIGSLSLLVGGRYDDAKTSSKDNLGMTTITESDHEFTGRVGAIYSFANGFAPYASYTESFEPVSGTAFDGSRFEPTKGEQYEVGVKYQPLGADHLVTVAAFDLTQTNVLTADPVNTGFSIQTGEVRTRGIEVEGKISLSKNLDVTAAYTFLDDEVTQSNNGDEGNRRAQIPQNSASFWAHYSIPDGPLSGIALGVGVRHTGKTQGDRGNTFSVPSYTLVDFAFSYDLAQSPLGLKGLSANVGVNNLFDKYYIASCFADHSCYLGQERTIRGSLRYTW